MTVESEQRRAAAWALLNEPLLGPGDELTAVRRHREDLGRFFADELGYRLDANRAGVARLAKTPGPGHVPRGLATRSGRPFDARRYALVCLILAALERGGERETAATPTGVDHRINLSRSYQTELRGDAVATNTMELCEDLDYLRRTCGADARGGTAGDTGPGQDALSAASRDSSGLGEGADGGGGLRKCFPSVSSWPW